MKEERSVIWDWGDPRAARLAEPVHVAVYLGVEKRQEKRREVNREEENSMEETDG